MKRLIKDNLNIFGNIDYVQIIEEQKKNNKNANNKNGFICYGMYVVGSSEKEFDNLLSDCKWMTF